MGLMRELFGPSQAEVWGELARQVGGHFRDGGFFGPSAVQVQVREWILTLDTFTVSTGKSSTTYTRMRSPFVNRDGLHFTLYRAGLFSELGKLFGMQDIHVGDPLFDDAFIIQSNYEARIRALLQDPRLRGLFQAQPSIYVTVKPDEGWFGAQFPQGVDELYFQTVGVVRDLPLLQYLFELFGALLDRLCFLDSGYQNEDPVLRAVRDLQRPGGRIVSQDLVLWDGGPPRRAAAETLGHLRDRRAVPALLHALQDRDDLLRLTAIRALGLLGDAAAGPAVVPFLGHSTLRQAAAEAAGLLGLGEEVQAFHAALGGASDAALRLDGPRRGAWIAALAAMLDDPQPFAAAHAGQALAALGATETLAGVQKAARRMSRGSRQREMLEGAEEELSRRRALPRPAEPPRPDTTELPRPAGPGG